MRRRLAYDFTILSRRPSLFGKSERTVTLNTDLNTLVKSGGLRRKEIAFSSISSVERDSATKVTLHLNGDKKKYSLRFRTPEEADEFEEELSNAIVPPLCGASPSTKPFDLLRQRIENLPFPPSNGLAIHPSSPASKRPSGALPPLPPNLFPATSVESDDDGSDGGSDGFHTPREYMLSPLVQMVSAKNQFPDHVSFPDPVPDRGSIEAGRFVEDSAVFALQPVQGLEKIVLWTLNEEVTTLASVLSGRRVLLTFLRHFGCVFCSKLAEQIRDVHRVAQQMGISMVTIGHGTVADALTWASSVRFPAAELYVDRERRSHAALGLSDHQGLSAISANCVASAVKAAREGHPYQLASGSASDQQAGAFLLDEDGAIEYEHRSRSPEDLPDLRAALLAADPAGSVMPEAGGSSEVSDAETVVSEEVGHLREALEAVYPTSTTSFSDRYLQSILAVPGRKFDYAKEKMLKCLELRTRLEVSTALWQQPPVLSQLEGGSMYWWCLDKHSRPVLFVRPMKKVWDNMDRDAEVKAHLAMIELGVAMMPAGVTTFCLISDCAGLGLKQNDPVLMKQLTSAVLAAYPDRLGHVCIGPLNALVRVGYRLLRPLLPARITPKIRLMKNPKEDLLEFLNPEDIPTFFGGPAVHNWDQSTTDGSGFSVPAMMERFLRKAASRPLYAVPESGAASPESAGGTPNRASPGSQGRQSSFRSQDDSISRSASTRTHIGDAEAKGDTRSPGPIEVQ